MELEEIASLLNLYSIQFQKPNLSLKLPVHFRLEEIGVPIELEDLEDQLEAILIDLTNLQEVPGKMINSGIGQTIDIQIAGIVIETMAETVAETMKREIIEGMIEIIGERTGEMTGQETMIDGMIEIGEKTVGGMITHQGKYTNIINIKHLLII